MRFLTRLIFSFASNLLALYLAAYFVKGFEIIPEVMNYLEVAAIFTLLNAFVRPVLKSILSPIIILTLGVGVVFINMFMLYLLDILSSGINIAGLMPFIYATLIISFVNIVLNFFRPKKED